MRLTRIEKYKQTYDYDILKINYISFWGNKKTRLIIKKKNISYASYLSTGNLIDISVYKTVLSFLQSEDLFWEIY